MSNEKKILIIGIAGGLAQITARLILEKMPDAEIIGVDPRDITSDLKLPRLKIIKMNYSRGNFENLFRSHSFDSVLHLGRLSHSSNDPDLLAKRLDMSVMGTSRILELCHRSEVKKIIILSTFHVYGAMADNPIFLDEDSPLRASVHHPELRDVIEMDQMCANWMYKNQQHHSTVVLRPCNIIGVQIQNSMSRFLTSQLAIRPIDFNPFFQFIHEFDMANIIVRSLNELPSGIYNVAPDDFISLRLALDLIGTKGIPFPITLAKGLNKLLKPFQSDVPEYLLDYLKYSCLIDNRLAKKFLGDDFLRYSIKETLELVRLR